MKLDVRKALHWVLPLLAISLFFIVWEPRHHPPPSHDPEVEHYANLADYYRALADSLQLVLRSAEQADSINVNAINNNPNHEAETIDSLRRLPADQRVEHFAEYVRNHKRGHDGTGSNVDGR